MLMYKLTVHQTRVDHSTKSGATAQCDIHLLLPLILHVCVSECRLYTHSPYTCLHSLQSSLSTFHWSENNQLYGPVEWANSETVSAAKLEQNTLTPQESSETNQLE